MKTCKTLGWYDTTTVQSTNDQAEANTVPQKDKVLCILELSISSEKQKPTFDVECGLACNLSQFIDCSEQVIARILWLSTEYGQRNDTVVVAHLVPL